MPKGEHSDEHNSSLAGEFSVDELRDFRRKYPIPEGMVVGSDEYKMWMAKQTVLRQKLYQKRAYLRRRKATLALQKYEGGKVETVEAAIAAVDAQLDEMRALRKEEVKIETSTPNPPAESRIPFIEEMAKEHGVSYEIAETVMSADDYVGEESWRTYLSGLAEKG